MGPSRGTPVPVVAHDAPRVRRDQPAGTRVVVNPGARARGHVEGSTLGRGRWGTAQGGERGPGPPLTRLPSSSARERQVGGKWRRAGSRKQQAGQQIGGPGRRGGGRTWTERVRPRPTPPDTPPDRVLDTQTPLQRTCFASCLVMPWTP